MADGGWRMADVGLRIGDWGLGNTILILMDLKKIFLVILYCSALGQNFQFNHL